MLLVTFALLFSSNLSLAAVIPSASLPYYPLEIRSTTPANFDDNSIKISEGKIILPESLQDELESEITAAQTELNRLSKSLSINFDNQDIGIVYLHLGRSDWSIKFTFGGIVLNTSEDIVVDTQEVFALKKCFDQVKWIEIKGKRYAATGYMTQIGGMLHAEE
ncbi:hypothetical protein Cri9333_4010 [Crinalium epipsammum PCC 9333]|uniref:Uncharacterized protein n=1 Tax=Crinalium epipsammum PCC 9333 TaxID=1173022 RepID=K9W4Z4_9CYAN|nr:hypothetical protein [Crinalium epipsammum]AFZ14817.1 hypothetical protein Cri9333_4010 [Crinalium epipsammum PCC 9333]